MRSTVINQPLPDLLRQQGGPAARLAWLVRMRLVPVHEILYRRGLLGHSMKELCVALFQSSTRNMPAIEAEESRVAAGLDAPGSRVLYIKGAHLARAIYPSPAQRLRSDLDLLVPEPDVDQAREQLTNAGYRTCHTPEARSTFSNQEQWLLRRQKGAFAVDLHWKPRSHPLLAEAMSFEDVWNRSRQLEDLTPARVPCLGDELLISAMHWIDLPADQEPCLIWLLDQQLLWEAMDDFGREQSAQRAIDAGIGGLLGHCLAQAAAVFAGDAGAETIAALNQVGRRESSRCLIAGPGGPFLRTWRRAISAKGIRPKLQHIGRSLFPPAAYMRRIYPAGSTFGLPGLYLQRLVARLFLQR